MQAQSDAASASTTVTTTATSAATNTASAASITAESASGAAFTAAKVPKPLDSRLIFGLGVGIPVALLTWGIADEDSPPAKFSKLIGLTRVVEGFADQFARPSREKLLPDWPVSVDVFRTLVFAFFFLFMILLFSWSTTYTVMIDRCLMYLRICHVHTHLS